MLKFFSFISFSSHSFYDIKSDIYNQDEPDLMNFNYTFPNMNLFSTLPINPYQSFQDIHIEQLAKQMAYSRMIEEIEYQRKNKKSKISTISLPSKHVNHLLNDIMIRMLNEVFDEQTKQQANPSRKGELLFVKKQSYNNDDTTIVNMKKQHKVRILNSFIYHLDFLYLNMKIQYQTNCRQIRIYFSNKFKFYLESSLINKLIITLFFYPAQ